MSILDYDITIEVYSLHASYLLSITYMNYDSFYGDIIWLSDGDVVRARSLTRLKCAEFRDDAFVERGTR
jgi:hypothetical protein